MSGDSQLIDKTFRILLGPREETISTRHKHGGLPSGMPESAVPCLDARNQPLHLLLEIDLTDPIFGLSNPSLNRLLVMNDANCYSFWEPMFYFVDENANRIELLKFEESEENEWAPRILPTRPVTIVPAEISPPSNSEEQRALEQSHFVGGKPAFIQGDHQLVCVRCGVEMGFIAQFASLNEHEDDVGFGDLGTLYAFLCPKCNVIATVADCY